MINSKTNIKFAWLWILMGVVSGIILSLFAFNGPIHLSGELMDYISLPRRFLRLAHISFFGLGFLNLVYGVTLNVWKLKFDKMSSYLLIFGSITMSFFLIISAFYEPFKYFLVIPMLSLLVGVLYFTKNLFGKN